MNPKTPKTLTGSKSVWVNVAVFILAFACFCLVSLLPHMKTLNLRSSLVEVSSILLLLGSVALYGFFTDKQTMSEPRKVLALYVTMLLCYGILFVLDSNWQFGLDIAPFALCSLVISLIVSGKLGFFANFAVIMMYFVKIINFGLEEEQFFVSDQSIYLLLAGVISSVYAAYVLGKHYRRIVYINVGLILGVISALCRVICYFMFLSVFERDYFIISVVLSFLSGIIGIMIMFIVVPVFEKIFNVVSVFRFSEIASSNTPLMRKLFEKAPGTYNHSLTVANYVEACASVIGESTVLARACAYYHDVGKIKNPSYFAENQTDGVNLHDHLTPESSVAIIKSHTVNGLAIAKEYGMPVEIQRAIMEHHGTMPVKYFYAKAQKYTDGKLDPADYSYDGPKPTSKISALLMICDACEAALRASNDRSKAEEIVDKIVNERLMFDQFSDCDITMKEIDAIKSTIITTYLGIRHKRVKYPEIDMRS